MTYTHNTVSGGYISPLYKRAVVVAAGSAVKVVTSVGMSGKASSQELYVLIAASLHKVVYDP